MVEKKKRSSECNTLGQLIDVLSFHNLIKFVVKSHSQTSVMHSCNPVNFDSRNSTTLKKQWYEDYGA